MSLLTAVIAIYAGFLFFVAERLVRAQKRGMSLRMRLFGALSAAAMVGALITGLTDVGDDLLSGEGKHVALRIAPKAFVIASILVVLAAGAAAVVGRMLAEPIEILIEAAKRIAEGERDALLPRTGPREALELARALTSMRRELEGRPYAAAFLRNAWHDLKSPVAAILATTELLEDGALGEPEVARRFVSNLRRSAEQLERTLQDLVTLSRYETATLAAEGSTAIDELVAAALAHVRSLAEATHVALLVEQRRGPDARVRGDPRALARAVGNLMENAVQASPGGTVVLAASRSGERAVVEVTNFPGEVPLMIRPRLFEGAVTARRPGGSGLGLAIARAAVEAHGGRIRFLEFGPPKVTVRIDLPMA
jgi:two-component system sensor histidine kinase CreC